mgnify:FL=1|jgi:hypothetical protein|tara:strand:+ start:369 stop:746 length:378 start_codon:yes stop_codon:yes gene_type:complete
MDYVYAISYKRNPLLIKVGMTTCWETRLENLKVPSLMKIEFIIKTFSDTYQAEKKIHKNFDEFRLPQTEYFYFRDKNQISSLKDFFAEHGEFVDASSSVKLEKARIKQSWAPRQGSINTLYISRS